RPQRRHSRDSGRHRLAGRRDRGALSVIKQWWIGHVGERMVSATRRFQLAPPARPMTVAVDRLSTMFHHHYDFVWRSVRRLRVPEDAVDDAAQEVFVVASRKLDAIELGKEKAFLFGTAMRVAADARRALQRRRQSSTGEPVEPLDVAPALDELVDQKRA